MMAKPNSGPTIREKQNHPQNTMLTSTLSPETIDEQLASFSGSLISHPYNGGLLLSEGVHWLAENVDLRRVFGFIIEARRKRAVKAETFQVYTLIVNRADRSAYLKVQDGDGVTLHGVNIAHTDYPRPELTLRVIDGTVLLPGEY